MRQMPPGSVALCIIDEISLCETELLSGHTDLVVRKLVRLANCHGDGDQVFELLITCENHNLEDSR